jgi:hypothetical protein
MSGSSLRTTLPGGDFYRDVAASLGIDRTSVGCDVSDLSA